MVISALFCFTNTLPSLKQDNLENTKTGWMLISFSAVAKGSHIGLTNFKIDVLIKKKEFYAH